MKQFQINSPEDFKELIDFKKQETTKIASAEAIKIAQEVSEREFDLFEFDLFLASFGKDKLDKSTKTIIELRKKVDKGEIDLSKYEDLFDY